MTTGGKIFEALSPERRKKSSIAADDLDESGVVRRLRVNDQSIFDVFLISELITRGEHEAAIRFLSALESSGLFPASFDIEKASTTPSYKVGDAISSRWMAFSGAYRFVCRDSGHESVGSLMKLIPHAYNWNMTLRKSNLESVAKRVQAALGSLAKFYRCEEREDPRDLIRSQIQK